MRRIEEPYPVVILPAFDQVLAEKDGTYSFVLPRFWLHFDSGQRQEITIDALFRNVRSIQGIRAYWVISRLAPPPGEDQSLPSLPTYGYVRGNSPSRPFLDHLAKHLGVPASSEPPISLSIDWERRRFRAQSGSLKELKPVHLGSVVVPVGSDRNAKP
jgi:hypothetical protein